MNAQIEQLKKEIADLKILIQSLLDWKREKEIQQLSFPLDKNSRDIINNP